MILFFGNFFLYLSLFCIFIFFSGFYKRIKLSEINFIKTTYIISAIPFVFLTIGFAISDFSISNVYRNSYIDDPFFFKITSMWGSHEGSILLWIFLINFFGFVFLMSNTTQDIHKQIIFISSLFLLYLVISSNPFEYFEAKSDDMGLGLNPILQNILFVIHPPTLFIGYIGLLIPFVLSSHMLITKNFSEELFTEMLFWSKISWFFLTFGIVLGSYWAYSELGWGGWWFWDPVENISLIPWLLNTALIHSLQVSIKNNQLKLWSLNIALYAFIAAVFGTFLVRSNLIISVHSFASDPLRGLFLILIIGYLFLVTIKLNLKSTNYFNQDTFNLISKESFLLLNNIFFIAAALTVFIGTIYPLFSEMFFQTSVSIGAPYYNFAFNLLMAPIILLMAFAPQIQWTKHKRKNNHNIYIIIISFITAILSYYYFSNLYFALGLFLTIPIFIKSAITFFKLYPKNKNFIAQWLGHLSIAIFIIAAVYTEQFDYEKNLLFEKNGETQIALDDNSIILLQDIENQQFKNYQKILISLLILKDKTEYKLTPSKNIYQPSGQVTNEVSTVNSHLHQFYATISKVESDQVSVNIVFKPLINLLWISAIMLVFSIFLSIIKRK